MRLVTSLGGHGDTAGQECQQSELHDPVRLLQRLCSRPGRKPRGLDPLDVLSWKLSYKEMWRREERGWRWRRSWRWKRGSLSEWSGRGGGGARDFLTRAHCQRRGAEESVLGLQARSVRGVCAVGDSSPLLSLGGFPELQVPCRIRRNLWLTAADVIHGISPPLDRAVGTPRRAVSLRGLGCIRARKVSHKTFRWPLGRHSSSMVGFGIVWFTG